MAVAAVDTAVGTVAVAAAAVVAVAVAVAAVAAAVAAAAVVAVAAVAAAAVHPLDVPATCRRRLQLTAKTRNCAVPLAPPRA
jgi:hypothetical protein